MTPGPADADLDCGRDPDAFADPPGIREWAYGLGGAIGLAFCGFVWLLALPFAAAACVALSLAGAPKEGLRRARRRG